MIFQRVSSVLTASVVINGILVTILFRGQVSAVKFYSDRVHLSKAVAADNTYSKSRITEEAAK